MENIFYFLFGWLVGSDSGEEVVEGVIEGVTSVPEALVTLCSDLMQFIVANPICFIGLVLCLIGIGIPLFRRMLEPFDSTESDNSDDKK